MKIELGKYYPFQELQRQWEENYPESEPLSIEFLEENLPKAIRLYQIEGNFVAFHLQDLSDIAQISEGVYPVERCKIDFQNPKTFSICASACGLDHGSHTEGLVIFQDSDKNFFVELKDLQHRKQFINIKKLFQEIPLKVRQKGYVYHFPARGVVIQNQTFSVNRAAHNADCDPHFAKMDLSQQSIYSLITSEDSYRPLNVQSEEGLRLTVFDKPYLSIENLSRRIYCNSNCVFVYDSPLHYAQQYHENYKHLMHLSFRFPDPNKILGFDKTEAAGYGTIALLGNSIEKNAGDYDQFTENFSKNFQRLYNEEISLSTLRKNRTYIEVFHSDMGGETREATMQSFTIDPPRKNNRQCTIRPCWLGYRQEKYTGGKYQNILFKDMIVTNLLMGLLSMQFGKVENTYDITSENEKKWNEESFQEGKKAFQEISALLDEFKENEEELDKLGSYCDLLQLPIFSKAIQENYLGDPLYSKEIEEILALTESILISPLNKSVLPEITKLNEERLLKYFRLDQRPVSIPSEYCRNPSLIYNIPLSPLDIPKKIAKFLTKIDNIKLTMPDNSKMRLKDALVHIAELLKVKWSAELEKTYIETDAEENDCFQYKQCRTIYLTAGEDTSLIQTYSHPDFYHQIESFVAGFCELHMEELTQISLFRTAQIILSVICAEESNNFALIQKRQDHFYFAPATEQDTKIDTNLQRLCKRAKIAWNQAYKAFENFPKQREKFAVDSFVVPLRETLGEILGNIIGIISEYRSDFLDVEQSWKEFVRMYKREPRRQTLQDWQRYCKEQDTPDEVMPNLTAAETSEIDLKRKADLMRKQRIDAPISIDLKKIKIPKWKEDSLLIAPKLPELMEKFMNCNKQVLRTEDWQIILTGMACYLAMADESAFPMMDEIFKTLNEQIPEVPNHLVSEASEEFAEQQKEFAKFWQPLPVPTQIMEDDFMALTIQKIYKNWLERVNKLLQEIRDADNVQGIPITNFRINESSGNKQTISTATAKKNVNSFVFYVFSGQGISVLHKFMAKHIYYSLLYSDMERQDFPKGYNNRIHFLDVDQLLSVVFNGAMDMPNLIDTYRVARRTLARKLLAPLGLAVIGSYRCSADNKITFGPCSEVALDSYDLLATSSVGPELENQINYIYTQELVPTIQDQIPTKQLQLPQEIIEPKEKIYYVPQSSQKPNYFLIGKNGGNVNIWKRTATRLKFGCEWQPQSYYFLGCFQFPEFEKEMELYLVPFVSTIHRKRQHKVAVFFKARKDYNLLAQPLSTRKLPANTLKLWDKDYDSATEEQAYPMEYFQSQVFILDELHPKQQVIVSLTGQNHFLRFKTLSEKN